MKVKVDELTNELQNCNQVLTKLQTKYDIEVISKEELSLELQKEKGWLDDWKNEKNNLSVNFVLKQAKANGDIVKYDKYASFLSLNLIFNNEINRERFFCFIEDDASGILKKIGGTAGGKLLSKEKTIGYISCVRDYFLWLKDKV